jgi:predicted ATPase/DNA-binding CsgD family transcriptional regulator
MTVKSISEQSRPKKLNKREREILQLMADEHSPNDIAVELVIAVETVDWYRRQILKKLEARDASQAVVIAHEMGLVEVAIEDETLPERPDDSVSQTAEVSAFFDSLLEDAPVTSASETESDPAELQVVADVPLVDELAEFGSEQGVGWSSQPESEWPTADFEPEPFEFEHIPDPFLALKGEEVVSDPLPFDVVLDDIATAVEDAGDSLELFSPGVMETEAEDVRSRLLDADDLQLEQQPAPSESDLVSLEQPVGDYELLLEFEEIELVTDSPAEPEPTPLHTVDDIANSLLFVDELHVQPQPAPSESDLVSLEQPVGDYAPLLEFEEIELATDVPAESELTPLYTVDDIASSLLYVDQLRVQPQSVPSESNLVRLEQPARDNKPLLEFEEIEPVPVELEPTPLHRVDDETPGDIASSLLYVDDLRVDFQPVPLESNLAGLEQPDRVYQFPLEFEEIEPPAELESTLQESHPFDNAEMTPEDVTSSLLYVDELQAESQPILSESDLVSLEQPIEDYESVLGFEEIGPAADRLSLSPTDTAEMPLIDELLAQFELDSISTKAETIRKEYVPTRKHRRKRKRKADQSESISSTAAHQESENVEVGAAETIPYQPVTAVFENEPVYGFDEDQQETEISQLPEFTLQAADPDFEAQSQLNWTAFDQVVEAAPTLESPGEVEVAENLPREQSHAEFQMEFRPVNNLPSPTEMLVGRRWEITEIKHLLASVRWLTLTGPSGVGKTRLALEVAQELRSEFPDGICFVSLAAIDNPMLVQDAILRTLGITQLKGKTTKDTLQYVFEQRSILLILDHVDSARHDIPGVMDLLSGTHFTVIATAHERLGLAEEIEFPVPTLEFPELKRRKKYRLADLEKAGALAFLIQQIQDSDPKYQPNDEEATSLAQICARLQGIPLALEWVAARSIQYPSQMILMQLDNRLRTLGSDPKTPPSPQQALYSALSWSHNLLSRDEQLLFAGFGLFGGSWTVEAAEAVFRSLVVISIPHAVASLAEKHLIRQHIRPNQSSRYSMDEAVREFALEKLLNHERLLETRASFAAHYVDLAEYAATELEGAERNLWLKRLEAEHDSFHNVLNWSLEYRHFETLARLTNALWPFWEATGRFAEGHYWLEQSLAQGAVTNSQAQTKLLYAAGVMAFQIGDYIKARGLLEECLVIHRFSGDRHAEAQILTVLSDTAIAEGDEPRAADLLMSTLSLGRQLNNHAMVFDTLQRLTALATRQRDFNILRAPLAEALEYFYQNEDLPSLTFSLLFPASLAAGLWQCDRAVKLYAVCSALIDATGLMLPPGESAHYDAALSEMRRFMGPEAFESAWEAGFEFTVEQAVSFALEYTRAL